MRKTKFHRFIWVAILAAIVSFISGVFIWNDSGRPFYYSSLPFLPIFHGLISLIFARNYRFMFNRKSIFIILSLYYLRNVITPFLMSLGKYSSAINIRSIENIENALVLMILETFLVYFFIFYYSNKQIRKIGFKFKLNEKKKYIFKVAMFLIISLMIISYIIIPEIGKKFISIFDKNAATQAVLITDFTLPTGSIKRSLYTLFDIFFGVIRLFIPAWIIFFIRKKVSFKYIAIILSSFVVFTQLLFFTNEVMSTFIVMTVLIMFIFKLFSNHKKFIFMYLGGGVMSSFVLILLAKSAESSSSIVNDFSAISKLMLAYFPGITNVAGIFNIREANTLNTLFADFYSTIPFRNTLFGIETSSTSLELFRVFNLGPGQIIPNVGQAFLYLGFLAPLASIYLVKVSIKYDYFQNSENNIFKFLTYNYILIVAAITPVFYYFTSFVGTFITLAIPMIILSKYSGNKFTFDKVSKSKRIRSNV